MQVPFFLFSFLWKGRKETYCKWEGCDTTEDAAVYSYKVGLSIDVDLENLALGVGRSIGEGQGLVGEPWEKRAAKGEAVEDRGFRLMLDTDCLNGLAAGTAAAVVGDDMPESGGSGKDDNAACDSGEAT